MALAECLPADLVVEAIAAGEAAIAEDLTAVASVEALAECLQEVLAVAFHQAAECHQGASGAECLQAVSPGDLVGAASVVEVTAAADLAP